MPLIVNYCHGGCRDIRDFRRASTDSHPREESRPPLCIQLVNRPRYGAQASTRAWG